MTFPRSHSRGLRRTTLAGTTLALLGLAAPAGAATWKADQDASASASTQGRATPRIVGGTVLPNTGTRPFTVAIQTVFPDDQTGGCSGTILDATHVLTAAHCVVEENGTLATNDQVAVAAGTSNIQSDAGVAQGVVKGVARIRVHPRHKAGGFEDDVAVLTLSTPLAFNANVQPIQMAPSGTFVNPGRSIAINGFGITGANNDDYGQLRTVNVRSVIGGSACTNGAPGTYVCTQGSNKGACSGDSGGNATIGGSGAARRVIGVTDIADAGCQGLNFFANLGAPEIRTFVDAAVAERDLTAAQTPLAPRGGRNIKVTGTARVGRRVTCARGSFRSATKYRYAFLLQRGSKQVNRGFRSTRTYTLRSADRGRRVFCAVKASSKGGTGISVGRNTKLVR